ncbi:MAG: glycerol-3-phosphate 1-O-acyltransferase PlsY [Turneriella sp.]|nr:glycerol-3-phosphate 1-O-acyltransferase PlsY [Turneriella sp.]
MDFSLAVAIAFAAYLVGSFPTAYLVVRWLKGIDIRTVGSGNVGATNAMRVLGKRWGIAILMVDALKGFVPVLLVLNHFPGSESQRYAMLAGICTMLGHAFPVWLRFRGGKSVATGLGVMLALVPLAVLAVLPVFVLVVVLSRYVSLGSIVAALLLPAAFFLKHRLPENIELFAFVCLACIFVVYKHRTNIKRILTGEESRLGQTAIAGNIKE